MTITRDTKLVIRDAQLIFKNFSGVEGKYNEEGDRNFAVLLDPDQGRQMLEDGWNIKYLKPREEGDEPRPILSVGLKYLRRDGKRVSQPPRVVMITSRGRTPLDSDVVDVLDSVDMRKVDLTIRPSFWEVRGERGIKAYLQSMFVTINEDPLEVEYGVAGEDFE